MRTYRLLAMVSMLATLATIGSFVLDLWNTVHPGAADRPAPKTERVPPAIRDTPPAQAGCDLQLYEPVRKKLREARRGLPVTGADRFERLGEDARHVFIYDHASDEIRCIERLAPIGPLVFGLGPDDRNASKAEVVFWCVLVIVVGSLLLAMVQTARRYK